MADKLDMGKLSLQDSQHASNGFGGGHEHSAYIPPHMRGKVGGPPPMNGGPSPMMNGPPGPASMDGSSWGPPPG